MGRPLGLDVGPSFQYCFFKGLLCSLVLGQICEVQRDPGHQWFPCGFHHLSLGGFMCIDVAELKMLLHDNAMCCVLGMVGYLDKGSIGSLPQSNGLYWCLKN